MYYNIIMGSYFLKQLNLDTSRNNITSKCYNVKTDLNDLERLFIQKVIVKTLIDNNVQTQVNTDEFNDLVKKLTDETLIIYKDKK